MNRREFLAKATLGRAPLGRPGADNTLLYGFTEFEDLADGHVGGAEGGGNLDGGVEEDVDLGGAGADGGVGGFAEFGVLDLDLAVLLGVGGGLVGFGCGGLGHGNLS